MWLLVRSIALEIFAFLLLGCATTVYSPAQSSQEASAKMVFIRMYAEPTAWNVNISLDKEKVVSLANSSYATIQVTPGIHTVSFTWPPFFAGQAPLDGVLKVEQSETAYYVYTAKFRFSGGGYSSVSMNKDLELLQLSKEDAEKLISVLDKK